MPIEWQDAGDIQRQALKVVIYGPPNIGKSSLALTAPDPVALDFDSGIHRASNRRGKRVPKPSPITNWEQVPNFTADDVKNDGIGSIIIDTVGTALDVMALDIIRQDPKTGRGGSLTLQGFGVLKGRFQTWLGGIISLGVHVIMVAHATEEQRGDETVQRIYGQGNSKQYIYQMADLMGYFRVDHRSKRVLTFSPTEATFGKNIGDMESRDIPLPLNDSTTLADIIQEALLTINHDAQDDAEEVKRLTELEKWLRALTPQSFAAVPAERRPEFLKSVTEPTLADTFTHFAIEITSQGASPTDRRLLLQVALERGLKWPEGADRFYEDPDAAPST